MYEEDPNLEIKKSEPKSNKGSLKKSNFKKTGGKQILFLAVCPGVPENYNNVKVLLDRIKVQLLENYRLTGDLKIYNIVVGIGTAASKYPCAFCLSFRDKDGYWVLAELRTWSNCIQNYFNWQQNGGKKEDLMKYKNCSNVPMIGPGTDEPVMWTMAPPALHIFLLVNHILKSLLDQWPYLSSWLKEVLHLVFAPYHGETLEGNDVSKLLKNLERMSEVVPDEFSDYLHCLSCFKEVASSCLTSKQLLDNYKEKIEEFAEAVYVLKDKFKMTISNKIHIVISDVPRFCDKGREKIRT